MRGGSMLLLGCALSAPIDQWSSDGLVPPQSAVALGQHLASLDASTLPGDLGAVYAATEPMIGLVVNWSMANATLTVLPRKACAPLAASIRRHTFWFSGRQDETDHHLDEGPDASNQQDAERAFLNAIDTSLCANPQQTEDEYTTILHEMFKEVRTHVNRHVHSAFWVKSACGEIDVCYDSRYPPTLECLLVVLDHEKYNLAEGFTFVNISYTLLARGADFCTDLERDTITKQWRVRMEDAMAYHASNHAFDDMLEAHFEQLCTGPDDYEGQYEEIFEAVAEQIDADVLADQDCSFSDEAFARMPFLSSNPPSADDLITVFEQNTWLTINAAAGAVKGVLGNESEMGGCLDPATRAVGVDTHLSATILADLNAQGIQPMDGGGDGTNGTRYASPQASHLSLATVYHKLMLMCVSDATYLNYTGVCQIGNGSLFQTNVDHVITESNPVFDIVTAADIKLCAGAACRDAARAVLDYQELLGSLTVMRWDVIRVAGGAAEEPEYNQSTYTLQRGCPALQAIVDNIKFISSALPAVVEGLRKASPQLEASCVSPGRSKMSVGRATVLLGVGKAKANAELWEENSIFPDECSGKK